MASNAAALSPHAPRIQPSVWVAFVVFVAYCAVVNGIQLTSGVPYAEFFASAENAWKSANLSLAAGCILLLAFAFWSRWDGLWRDPARLPMTPMMWLAPVVFVLMLCIRLVLKLSAGVPMDLVLAILFAGAGVGLAEELLFRGIILRSLRTNGRPEAWAMFWCSVWFGMMHAINVFLGSPPGAVALQVVIASLTGATLYLLRRSRGLLLTGLIAHGAWDVSTFLPAPESSMQSTFEMVSLGLSILVALIGWIAVFRHDRKITMTPTGPAPVAG